MIQLLMMDRNTTRGVIRAQLLKVIPFWNNDKKISILQKRVAHLSKS
jgi:hypothetical protein